MPPSRLVSALLAVFVLWLQNPASAAPPAALRFLALDNGDHRLVHVDQTGATPRWSVEIPPGARDLRLLPDGQRVLLSHGTGLQIRRLSDGALAGLDLRSFAKIQSALALPDGGFLLAAGDKTGVTLLTLDAAGTEISRRSLPGYQELRLLRPGTAPDTVLLTTASPFRVAEVHLDGRELRSWPLRGKGYVATLSADGTLHAPNGGACEIERFATDGTPLPALGGKGSAPGLDWFSGCHVLADGSVVVANWMGHLPRDQRHGPHLLRYAADGRLLWSWSDPAVAQVTNVLVLPGAANTPPTAASVAPPVHVLFAFDGTDRGGLDLYASPDGLAWRTLATNTFNPRIGAWGIFRDPCVVRDAAGIFHLLWTTGDNHFGHARSTDAVHWTDPRVIDVSDPTRGLDFQNVWAPFAHLESDGAVTVIWTSTLRRDYAPPADPAKWWTARWNHRLYAATTRDWQTFTPTQPYWNPDHPVIDAKLHRRGPADYVLIYKDERPRVKQLRIAYGRSPAGPFERSRELAANYTEGAIILPRGPADHLVLYDRYQSVGYEALHSPDLETFSAPLALTKDDRARKLRHGSIITLSTADLATIEAALAARTPE